MEPIVLEDAATNSVARIAAELGFNCYEFRADVEGSVLDVIDSSPEFLAGDGRFSGNGIPILFPFPNRIRDGRYRWGGRQFAIPSSVAPYDPAGNAIHGFCLDRPWRIVDRAEHFVTGQFQLSIDAPDRLPFWPGDCLIEVRYELQGPALQARIRIANTGERPVPWGLGTHPYFRVPLSPDSRASRCLTQAPATRQWELIDCLPTGKCIPLPPDKDMTDGVYFGTLHLDDVMTGLQPSGRTLECLIVDEQAGLQISQQCDPIFRELVVYMPPGRDAVCLEPYTCVTDAVNLQEEGIDAGLRVLEPGEECLTWITIHAGLVIA